MSYPNVFKILETLSEAKDTSVRRLGYRFLSKLPQSGALREFGESLYYKNAITMARNGRLLVNKLLLKDLYEELLNKKDFYTFLNRMDHTEAYPLSPVELYLYNYVFSKTHFGEVYSDDSEILRELGISPKTGKVTLDFLKRKIAGSTFVLDKLASLLENRTHLPLLNGLFVVHKDAPFYVALEKYVQYATGVYCFKVEEKQILIEDTPCLHGDWERILIGECDVWYFLLKPLFPTMSLPQAVVGDRSNSWANPSSVPPQRDGGRYFAKKPANLSVRTVAWLCSSSFVAFAALAVYLGGSWGWFAVVLLLVSLLLGGATYLLVHFL